MVEGARLESVYTRKGIAGSNPALSALVLIYRLLAVFCNFFVTILALPLASEDLQERNKRDQYGQHQRT